MNVKLVLTGDGSHTLFVPELREHFHSTFGAIRESKHVFLDAGFRYRMKQPGLKSILEIGFGTGLNAFLTLLVSEASGFNLSYTAIEPEPLPSSVVRTLNYAELIDPSKTSLFNALHETPWNIEYKITENFTLIKHKSRFEDKVLENDSYDLVYFDAFGPEIQPELWTESIFKKIYLSMRNSGALTTYSVKGSVKRALRIAGFTIEKLPGPPGKREITRALK